MPRSDIVPNIFYNNAKNINIVMSDILRYDTNKSSFVFTKNNSHKLMF